MRSVEHARQTFDTDDESVRGTINRLCELVAASIAVMAPVALTRHRIATEYDKPRALPSSRQPRRNPRLGQTQRLTTRLIRRCTHGNRRDRVSDRAAVDVCRDHTCSVDD